MTAVSTYSPTGNAYVDGVLTGVKWAVSALTYSFPTSGSFYGSGYGNGEPSNNFAALNSVQQDAVRTVLASYAAVANVTFTEVTETASTHADLRYAESDAPSTSWAYYPSTSPLAAMSGSQFDPLVRQPGRRQLRLGDDDPRDRPRHGSEAPA